MICSLSVSSVHGILQARILEWLPLPSPGDLPDPGISLITGRLFTVWAIREEYRMICKTELLIFFFSSQSFTFPIDPQWMATPSVQFLKAKTQDLAIDPDWIHHLPHTKPLSSPTNSTSPGISEKHHILSTSVTPPSSRSPAFLPALPALYFYSSLTSKLLE